MAKINLGGSERNLFRFLGLPTDIRVMIYPYILDWPVTENKIREDPNQFKFTCPSILLVCKQIKEEVLGELLRKPLKLPQLILFRARRGHYAASPLNLMYVVEEPRLIIPVTTLLRVQKMELSISYSNVKTYRLLETMNEMLCRTWRLSTPILRKLTLRFMPEVFNIPPEPYPYGWCIEAMRTIVMRQYSFMIGMLPSDCELVILGANEEIELI